MLFSIPVYAKETIDLDRYSTCDSYGNCKTEVDINELTLTKEAKDFLKDVSCGDVSPKDVSLCEDVSSYEMSHSIESFSIEILDKEKLLISGHITQNTYWSIDLGAVLLDPWWNFTKETTTNYTFTGTVPDSDGGTSQKYVCYNYTPNMTVQIYDIVKYSSAGPTFTEILNGTSNAIMYTGSNYTGDNSTFATAILEADYPFLICNRYPATHGYYKLDNAYPFVYEYGNVTGRCYGAPPSWTSCDTDATTDIIYFVAGNTTSSEETIWYNTYLYLNSNESNITLTTDDILNVTATTNLTGLTALVYIGDVLSANATTTATNSTNLTVGLWNITSWIGNVSTNETKTFWATITMPPVATGYVYCYDNDTLAHINVTNLETDNTISYYEWCNNGCDNVTFSCRYPPYVEDAIGFLVVIAFFIAMAIIFKWRRY